MNIILVVHDTVYSRYLAYTLVGMGVIDKVIVETSGPSLKFYAKKLWKVGLVNFIFQCFLKVWFENQGTKFLPKRKMPGHITIGNVNDYVFDFEDIVIGFGSSFITRKTLRSLKHGFLNIHTGILPEYKGVKSEFWALQAKDYDNLGWTLHYMTSNIDGGSIIHQERVFFGGENPAELRVRIVRNIPSVLGFLLNRFRRTGKFPSAYSQGKGNYFTTPTLIEWYRYRIKDKKES